MLSSGGEGEASDKKVSVCLSVYLFVKRVDCDKTEERSVQILHNTKGHLTQFSKKKNGWWGQPLLPEILGQAYPVGAKSRIFSRYALVPPQQ